MVRVSPSHSKIAAWRETDLRTGPSSSSSPTEMTVPLTRTLPFFPEPMTAVTFALRVLCVYWPQPVFNMLFVWCFIVLSGNMIRLLYNLFGGQKAWRWLQDVWAVLNTFAFISFTRLFFRSGSNLDPAEANETAWNTAKNMVNQIGGHWRLEQIPDIVYHYRSVFILIVLGMIIHWLPENFKRRYRIWFAKMPLLLMVLVCVLIVFVIYQFITADLQAFIYFQF